MSAILEAAANGASLASDAPLRKIIEFGRKALRDERSDELAFDLLGLDGVRLPLKATQLPISGTRWRMMVSRWPAFTDRASRSGTPRPD
jgi:hypothetical protein